MEKIVWDMDCNEELIYLDKIQSFCSNSISLNLRLLFEKIQKSLTNRTEDNERIENLIV